jgi:hypothetical protein
MTMLAIQLHPFEIVGNLVLEDILRAQRIISFIRWYVAHHLMPIRLYAN